MEKKPVVVRVTKEEFELSNGEIYGRRSHMTKKNKENEDKQILNDVKFVDGEEMKKAA